jgi:intracellular multiplication protein IcmW
MPDLSNKEVHEFWHEYDDPIIYKIISFMESVENWTSEDNTALEKALEKLGTTLDDIGNIDLLEEDKIIQVAANLKMGRALRLLQGLDLAHPGAAAKILMQAESSAGTNNWAALFLRRNIVFERLRLLSRIFSPERLSIIAKGVSAHA